MTTINEPERKATNWLAQQGVEPVSLKRMSGYTNHVFLVTQESAQDSVLRLANPESGAGFCPLAHDTTRVCKMHQQAAELGLAPGLMATDIPAGVMWLKYAGEPQRVTRDNFGGLQDMLHRLHHSGFNWAESGGQAADGAGLGYLEQLIHSVDDSAQPDRVLARHYAQQLYQLGEQRGYADYPLVPVHSDLNPGNCLYDKVRNRWFMIDWDFAGMRVAEWDYAGLVVEHGWNIEQCRAFAPPPLLTVNLIWFCAVLALLSWDWHEQNGSAEAILKAKQDVLIYWMSHQP